MKQLGGMGGGGLGGMGLPKFPGQRG
jgi:hypothetical protein